MNTIGCRPPILVHDGMVEPQQGSPSEAVIYHVCVREAWYPGTVDKDRRGSADAQQSRNVRRVDEPQDCAQRRQPEHRRGWS